MTISPPLSGLCFISSLTIEDLYQPYSNNLLDAGSPCCRMTTIESKHTGARNYKMNLQSFFGVELVQNADGSVTGMLPSGLCVGWSKDAYKPTLSNKEVTVNGYNWPCVWVDSFSEKVTINAFVGV